MPRISRSSSKSHYFHTMVQGIEKKFIFDDPAYMNRYLDLIQQKSKVANVSILAYCIMDNHAHILIHTRNVSNMTKFFRCVNTSYARYFNLKNQRVGYVFRNRYNSEEIFTINQLFNTINYIHNNPVKANLCNQPEKYRYSSYLEYFSESKIINKKILYHFFDENHFDKFFKISTN